MFSLIEHLLVLLIALALLLVVTLNITGCSSKQVNPSVETMKLCKTVCRGGVTVYQDDTITCNCKP